MKNTSVENKDPVHELLNEQFALLHEIDKEKFEHYCLPSYIELFDKFNEDNRRLLAADLIIHNMINYLRFSVFKDDIVSYMSEVFPTIISTKGLKAISRARYLLALSEFNPTLAQSYIPKYENDMCELLCKGRDLALLKTHFAPLSAKIQAHVSLLVLKEYKTNSFVDNMNAIELIYSMFPSLSAKVQRSMFSLIQTIITHHSGELSNEAYFKHHEKLLGLLSINQKFLSAYKGVELQRLGDATEAPSLVRQYALYPLTQISTEHNIFRISGVYYGQKVDIDEPFLTEANIPGSATMMDFLFSNFAYNQNHLEVLMNYLKGASKVTEIVLILRLVDTNYIHFSNLYGYYKPLAIIEKMYGFPVKERLDAIISEELSALNNGLREDRHKGQYVHSYLDSDLTSYKVKFQKMIEDIIFHLIPREKREILHLESVLSGQTHPLNVSEHFFGALYDHDSNTFLHERDPHRRYEYPTDMEKARQEFERNIQNLNAVLLEQAIEMGFTPDEIDLFF